MENKKEGFLVLTRKMNQSLSIELDDGSKISVTFLGMHGKQAKLGVKAPRKIAVHRDEVWERIENNNNKK